MSTTDPSETETESDRSEKAIIKTLLAMGVVLPLMPILGLTFRGDATGLPLDPRIGYIGGAFCLLLGAAAAAVRSAQQKRKAKGP